MKLLTWLAPKSVAHAHCDLPCGVYDPAQALIEAQSVKAIAEKYQANDDPAFRTRALIIKEQRSELVKHHLTGTYPAGTPREQPVTRTQRGLHGALRDRDSHHRPALGAGVHVYLPAYGVVSEVTP